MNHYPHHIGDFNSATRHLTFVERALYRELLDLYYDTEHPLNADATKLARRVLAHTDEQRTALDTVLNEFFELQDDGWHNARCDREIAAYRQKLEQQTKAGQASAAKRRKKPGGSGGGGDRPGDDVVGGATPVQRPLNARTTNQNQNQNQNHIKETSSPKPDDGATLVQPAGDTVPKSEGEWAVLFGSEFGVEVDHTDLQDRKKFWPKAKAWVLARVTLQQMRAAVAKARDESTEGISYLPAYVDRVLATMSAPPAESRAEAAARHRMAEAAPLAAARAPSNAVPAAMADGYQFFKDRAESVQTLLPVEVAHA